HFKLHARAMNDKRYDPPPGRDVIGAARPRVSMPRILGYVYCTSLPVLLGAAFAANFVAMCPLHASPRSTDFIAGFVAWDGRSYADIASEGYSYSPTRMSNVAFFPLFPALGAAAAKLTGAATPLALLMVSHAALVGAFALLAVYAQARRPDAPPTATGYALLAFGLFPTTFYFRMAYSEPLFLLLALAAMLGMQRRWPAIRVALLIGLATAARPVGVALLAPFTIYLLSPPAVAAAAPPARSGLPLAVRVLAAAPLLLLACWGLAAYMAYQWRAFGEPLAFAKTQAHWGHSIAHHSWSQMAWRLLTLAPLRAVYDRADPCYWRLHPPQQAWMFNLMFANPFYFVFAIASVALGAARRWLNAREVALAAMLLAIPYVTQSDRMCMASQARFAAVVFPMYLVLGRLLESIPPPLVGAICGVSGLMLGLYSALFVSWYWCY
ncbi:MAG TPA: mannosyltransferase family protein, partial [Pirellulales bacterium]|nr:mannosyltransferase family protein [Pirellulales bacterium]